MWSWYFLVYEKHSLSIPTPQLLEILKGTGICLLKFLNLINPLSNSIYLEIRNDFASNSTKKHIHLSED